MQISGVMIALFPIMITGLAVMTVNIHELNDYFSSWMPDIYFI